MLEEPKWGHSQQEAMGSDIFGQHEKSPGFQDFDWLCALPQCPTGDKVEENHASDNYETCLRFQSLGCSRQLTMVPGKSAPTRRSGNSWAVPTGLTGTLWPLTKERSEKHQRWERLIDATAPLPYAETLSSNIPRISPQGDGICMMTRIPASQRSQQNEERGTKRPVLMLFC